jgi:hypothetical protein
LRRLRLHRHGRRLRVAVRGLGLARIAVTLLDRRLGLARVAVARLGGGRRLTRVAVARLGRGRRLGVAVRLLRRGRGLSGLRGGGVCG